MDKNLKIRCMISTALVLLVLCFAGVTVAAQEPSSAEVKPAAAEKNSGRDPFKRYEVVRKVKVAPTKLEPPSIQVRIDRYRAQKLAAASAHVAPPKPTTALLLSEVQVTGIFRTPRGWSAMVEVTPFNPKLSYVIYPGESFFDGQLVAIEEGRLVFRRDLVWSDNRRDRTVEVKPLRAPSPIEGITAKATPATASAPEAEKSAAATKQ